MVAIIGGGDKGGSSNGGRADGGDGVGNNNCKGITVVRIVESGR